jgi:hypothetical protein
MRSIFGAFFVAAWLGAGGADFLLAKAAQLIA